MGPLKERFREVTEDISDFPDVGKNPSKAVMLESLRKYEEDRPTFALRNVVMTFFMARLVESAC